jgi:glycerol kinase
VEHDPREILASQRATLIDVLRRAQATPRDIVAVGITNQRETTVLWDRASGEPVANAIVWQDRRTAAACEALRSAGHESEVARRTGLLFDPYFSGTKLAWLLEHVPGARARAERGELAFGTIDSWLLFHLSGGRRHVTDATNASRTLLYNLATGDWDDWLLSMLGIPRACLPEIVDSGTKPSRSKSTASNYPCRASLATSRRHCSARVAASRAWQRTPTVRAALRSASPAPGRITRVTDC